MLKINELKVNVDSKEIVRGVSFDLESGKVVALMGPNGSGKSTVANALMGNPKYKVISGSVSLDGRDLLSLPVNERSKEGLFLSFQYPHDVSGVSLSNFLRTALNARREKPLSVLEFRKELERAMDVLEIPYSFADRNLNQGFSGGEKKRAEMLQLLILKPKFAVFDETDSGLDVDALKIVSKTIGTLVKENLGCLVITHHKKILDYLEPDSILVMDNGKIVKRGGKELAHELESKGFKIALESK